MADKILVDTNILLYAYDKGEPTKQPLAAETLNRLATLRLGVLTPQVLRTYQMAYWDAQIWALARLHRIPLIFTEDFNIGAVIEGVRFVNPLEENFDLDGWLSM